MAGKISVASGAAVGGYALTWTGGTLTTLINNVNWASDGTSQLALDTDAASATVSSVITNPTSGPSSGVPIGVIAFNPAGQLTLRAANTYTGVTTVLGGVLNAAKVVVWGGTSNIGNATSAVVLGSSSLSTDMKGAFNYTGTSANYTRGFVLNNGGGEIDTANAGQTLTVSGGNITGTGPLTVGGLEIRPSPVRLPRPTPERLPP